MFFKSKTADKSKLCSITNFICRQFTSYTHTLCWDEIGFFFFFAQFIFILYWKMFSFGVLHQPIDNRSKDWDRARVRWACAIKNKTRLTVHFCGFQWPTKVNSKNLRKRDRINRRIKKREKQKNKKKFCIKIIWKQIYVQWLYNDVHV